MTRICYLLMSFALLVAGTTNETPQQVVTRYNNYKAICTGMGFKNVRCKDHVRRETTVFQSSLSKTLQNMKSQATVVFDKVSLNEGNAYDNTSGIFTAPSVGIYSFTWTMLTTSGKYFPTEIVRNGQKVAYNYTDGRGRDGYTVSTSHANIKMEKGDRVWIRTWGAHGLYAPGGDWSYFSGVKL